MQLAVQLAVQLALQLAVQPALRPPVQLAVQLAVQLVVHRNGGSGEQKGEHGDGKRGVDLAQNYRLRSFSLLALFSPSCTSVPVRVSEEYPGSSCPET